MLYLLIVIGIIVAIILFAPRPRLDAAPRKSQVPNIPIAQLPEWLAGQEDRVPNLTEGSAAHIVWADPSRKDRTRYCFLYLHGFSATWRETAPLTERLAEARGANVVHGRLAGHGEGAEGMLTPAEHWLQSVVDHFDIASRLGEKVVIVGTSTGCTVATWLIDQPVAAEKVHACLFLSPNFRIRSAFGFLLTWPLSKYWIHWLLGRQRRWEPISEDQAKAWTHEYSTLALIEMQKTVDYVKDMDFGRLHTPLVVMYMKNDQTIHPATAIQVFDRWGARHKKLIRVELEGEAEQHVFVGDIVAPQRLAWCLERLNLFLDGLDRA